MATTKDFWKQYGFYDWGNYTAVPTFFTKELMAVGIGINPLFWKFTSIAWRNWMAPEKDEQTEQFVFRHNFSFYKELLSSEYGIHGEATAWCAAAYRVSGFCQLVKGRRHNFKLTGVPSLLHYVKDTTKNDWLAFVAALKVRTRKDKKEGWGGHDDAFCVHLAEDVVAQRTALGLGSQHMATFFDKMRASGVIKVRGDEEFVTRKPKRRFTESAVSF